MSNENTGTASTITFPGGGFQAIASAYGEYAKKSFEDTKDFVEKLSAVRSLEKAIEVQSDFAKTAYETFVTESQKIGALYGDSCQAVVQTIRWPCRKDDTDQSIGLVCAC
jgi:hypothetical protein